MTSTAHGLPTTRRTPGSIVTVRILACVQAVSALVGVAGAVLVGLVAALGFALQLDMDTDGTSFVLGLAAALGLLLSVVAGLWAASTRLAQGRRSGRIALVVLQTLLLTGALLLATVGGDASNVAAVATPVAIALALSAVGALVVLSARSTGRWCRGEGRR